ncbi:MAG: DUF3048 domain-containing protein [Oscillospiraceae bacterium]|nr:DUF3048 domain-containing protein [Oscillospiraceae bacterium]
MARKLRLWTVLVCLTCIIASCGVPISQSEPIPTPPQIPVPEVIEFPNPLTGLELGSAELMRLRPIAVMHNNLKEAMPLLGVSRADILYEIQTEGGITRILGLYQNINDVPLIGSIRSTRTCFLETALSHDAVLIHAGASRFAREELGRWEMDSIDAQRQSPEHFWRDQDRRAAGYHLEHTMVTDGKSAREIFNQRTRTELEENFTPPQKFTAESALTDATPAVDINVTVSGAKTTGFAYDPDTKLYTVSQYGDVMKDGSADNKPVEVTSLVVIQTDISSMGTSKGHSEVNLQTSGKGWYAAGGEYIPILWSRSGLREPIIYTQSDGSELVFPRGRIYVCVVPNGRDPDFS